MTFLTVEKLCKSFGGLRAVHNVDFEVQQGEIVGLIGPNGSGKTVTINLLTGFHKPDAGKITFNGKDVTHMPRCGACRYGMARTFQLVKPFLQFTALQNVMVGRAFGQAPARDLRVATAEAKEWLNRVGLLRKADIQAKDLTLMERKRLELARAMAAKPSLLLLDELMAGLNHAEAEDAMTLIKGLKQEANLTIVIVEHIVKAILGLSDRVIVLNMGEKIAEGTPQEVMHNPTVVDVYLGKPHA